MYICDDKCQLQEMADITSKTAMAPITPKVAAADKHGSHEGLGFSSLPSSIHHGLSEKLQGITEKLHQLGQKSVEASPAGGGGDMGADSLRSRSRTSSWGTGAHPSLAIQFRDGGTAMAAATASCQSPSRTCSRTSSKKSNQSTLISNGKVTEGNKTNLKSTEKFEKKPHWGHEKKVNKVKLAES